MSETEGKVRLGPIRRSETSPTSVDPTVQTLGPPGVGTALSGGGTGNREQGKHSKNSPPGLLRFALQKRENELRKKTQYELGLRGDE